MKKLGIALDVHLGSLAANVTSETSTHPYIVIDLVTSSAVSPTISAPIAILGSPVSEVSIPSNAGSDGNRQYFQLYTML